MSGIVKIQYLLYINKIWLLKCLLKNFDILFCFYVDQNFEVTQSGRETFSLISHRHPNPLIMSRTLFSYH